MQNLCKRAPVIHVCCHVPFTRSGGLWDCLVDACVETAADGNVTGGVAGLSSLVPQLLFPPPFRSSV